MDSEEWTNSTSFAPTEGSERHVLEYLLIEPVGDKAQYKDKNRTHEAHDPS